MCALIESNLLYLQVCVGEEEREGDGEDGCIGHSYYNIAPESTLESQSWTFCHSKSGDLCIAIVKC